MYLGLNDDGEEFEALTPKKDPRTRHFGASVACCPY